MDRSDSTAPGFSQSSLERQVGELQRRRQLREQQLALRQQALPDRVSAQNWGTYSVWRRRPPA